MDQDIILLGHGSGGKLSHQLLDDLIIPTLSHLARQDQDDAATLLHKGERLAFTTDSYVVDPIFFPGGTIGDLAIHGTINDLAMIGASPLAVSVGLILEEGLPKADLRRVLDSMKQAARNAGVSIVTGDTKVVPRGKADRIFINTSGIGVFRHEINLSGRNARPGDKILISGTIGDHGMAILTAREGLALEAAIESDSAPLNGLVDTLLDEIGGALRTLRDPTRGGVATTLNEIALQSAVDIVLDEASQPIRDDVAGACAILGLDPLFVANEGKMLVVVASEQADRALRIMRRHPLGKNAAMIGSVTQPSPGRVVMKTALGGIRAIGMLTGEQLPRIC